MKINKWIFYTIFEIITLVIVLITTNILWNKFDLEEHANLAFSYVKTNTSLVTSIENHLSPLIPIKDNELTDFNKITINVNNISKSEKKYNLYIVINNKSNLNLKYLKFLIKNEKNYITNQPNFIKGNDTYYLINSNKITDYIKEDLYIWLDETTPNEEQGKKINFQIITEEILKG